MVVQWPQLGEEEVAPAVQVEKATAVRKKPPVRMEQVRGCHCRDVPMPSCLGLDNERHRAHCSRRMPPLRASETGASTEETASSRMRRCWPRHAW